MDEFARRPPDDRRVYFREGAERRDVQPFIIEKDFWVCWTLRRLVQSPKLAGHLTFKGGTSLSKAYGIIERFSEDIDLTIARDAPFVCDVASPMEEDISGKERQRRTKDLKAAAQAYVETVAMPALQAAITEAFGTAEEWDVVLDPDDPDAQTLLFRYPKHFPYSTFISVGGPLGSAPVGAAPLGGSVTEERPGYVQPRIKLEFGARGETEPWEMKRISPYLADIFSDEFTDPITEVPTLSAARTFWEKATILHALHHGANLRREMSRHYYDTLKLAEHGVADAALAEPELLERVVRNKSLMFPDAKASYDTATRGTLRLVPTGDLRTRLAQDYRDMAVMFMSPPPDFDTLMSGLEALEAKINQN